MGGALKTSICILAFGASFAVGLPVRATSDEVEKACFMDEPDQFSPLADLARTDPAAFAKEPVRLDNGITGRLMTFESRTPQDFAPMFAGKLGLSVSLGAQLFVPLAAEQHPAIIMVPGSANIGPHHLEQVAALTSAGLAVLLIDPFYGRGLSSTIEDQAKLSWAASTYDVAAAFKVLKTVNDIDGDKIGVLGSSRGGTATLMALTTQVSDVLFAEGDQLRAGFAGYPWCGLQFWNARIAKHSSLLIMSGSKDDWVSVQQCQDFAHASAQNNSQVRLALVPRAYHAFDRSGVEPTRLNDVRTSPSYPTVYMNDEGIYLDPQTGVADRTITSRDFLDDAVDGGFIRQGVTIGTCGSQAQDYRDAMVRFFTETLEPSGNHHDV